MIVTYNVEVTHDGKRLETVDVKTYSLTHDPIQLNVEYRDGMTIQWTADGLDFGAWPSDLEVTQANELLMTVRAEAARRASELILGK